MKIREYEDADKESVEKIFAQYWNDNEFLNELSHNIDTRNGRYYIAEKEGEVVGVAGYRDAPEYLKAHAKTKKPAELYIVASKHSGEGVGSALIAKIEESAKRESFTEIQCYSPGTHSNSWKFYEHLGFVQHGTINDPDDDCPGMLLIKTFP